MATIGQFISSEDAKKLMSDGISVNPDLIKEDLTADEPQITYANPEDEAASIMANARKQRVEEVKEKLEKKIKDYRAEMKTLTVLKKTKKSLLDEYLMLTRENKGTLVDEYRKIITQLKISEIITAVDVDSKKRLVFTTRPIVVKKAKWKNARLAGVYQVRVDFAKEYRDIDILNITQRSDSHDHPHITDTNPCWGNVSSDIEQDWKDKNLYELLVDIVDYLQSGADNDGYLQFNGDEEMLKQEFGSDEKDSDSTGTHAWEQFLTNAKKMPEGFNFDVYEQQKEEKKSSEVLVKNDEVDYTPVNGAGGTSLYGMRFEMSTASSATVPASEDGIWRYYTNNSISVSPYQNHRAVSFYESEMQRHLMELGLTEKSAWHFVDYIKPSQDRYITHLELVDRGDFFWLLVHTNTPPQPLRVWSVEDPLQMADTITINPDTIQRIFINREDIQPDVLQNEGIMPSGHMRGLAVSVRINENYFEEQRREEEREQRRQAMEAHAQSVLQSAPVRQVHSDAELTEGAPREPLGDSEHTGEISVDPLVSNSEYFKFIDFGDEAEDKANYPKKLYSPEAAMQNYGIVAAAKEKPVPLRENSKTVKLGDLPTAAVKSLLGKEVKE